LEKAEKKGRVKQKACRGRRKNSRKKKRQQILVLFCPRAKSQRRRKM
jgi:hypothetical protein